MQNIREKIEEADLKLKEYIKVANQIGKLICEKLKKEKGWECEYDLGDYEEGQDYIKISVNSGACCFGEILDEELNWYKEIDDKSLRIGFKPGNFELLSKHCKEHYGEK